MNPFGDGSSDIGGDAPGERPPGDDFPFDGEPEAPGELYGIVPDGEYYSGVTIMWAEDDSLSVRAFVRRVEEGQEFFEVSQGYQIELQNDEVEAEYEVKLELDDGAAAAEKSYRFTIHSSWSDPLTVHGIERNGVYTEPVAFSWSLDLPGETDIAATAGIRRELSDAAWSYGDTEFHASGTAISENGTYVALIRYRRAGRFTTAFYPFTVAISGGLPTPQIFGISSVATAYTLPLAVSWAIPSHASTGITTTSELLLEEGVVAGFSSGDELTLAGDYELTVTYAKDGHTNAESVSFGVWPQKPSITFASDGLTYSARSAFDYGDGSGYGPNGPAAQYYRDVTVSWSNFPPGSERRYTITRWDDEDDTSGDDTVFDSADFGDSWTDEYAVTENGIYRFLVRYEQNGKARVAIRTVELRRIPEVNLQAEVQPDGTVLVGWDAPPVYVDVAGRYDAVILTEDGTAGDGPPVPLWHSGTFDDAAGNTFVIDDWPVSGTVVYVSVNVWFSDPEGLGDVVSFAGPYNPLGDVDISGNAFGAPVYLGEFAVEALE